MAHSVRKFRASKTSHEDCRPCFLVRDPGLPHTSNWTFSPTFPDSVDAEAARKLEDN